MNTRQLICLVALSLGFSAPHPAAGAVNEWIKPTSGYWEEQASWSLGVLPNATQDVVFANAGWKALVIGTNTAQSFPQSLHVQSLSVGAPVDSYNTLLMNFSGLAQPLFTGYLTIGSNGAVVMQSSALDSGGLTVGGTFSQGDFSQVKVHGRLIVGGSGGGAYSGAYFLTNGTLTVEGNGYEIAEFINGGFQGQGTFVQYGGLNNARSIEVSINGEFDLYGGQVNATNGLTVGISDYANYATFHQYGGTVNADTVINGNYFLDAGQLTGHMVVVSDTFQRVDAHVSQSGGTNSAISLDLGHPNRFGGKAFYVLSNGVVQVDSTVTLHGGQFSQYNGRHTIVSNLVIQSTEGGLDINDAKYLLAGGTLSAGGLMAQSAHFEQTGGSNLITGDIFIIGLPPANPPPVVDYTLSGGFLSARNLIVNTGYSSGFRQTGGLNQITEKLTVQGVAPGSFNYTLEGGTLAVKDIFLSAGAFFQHTSGNIIHSGVLTLNIGDWHAAPGDHSLGPLQSAGTNSSAISLPDGSSILRVANSSAQPWSPSAILYINNWHGSTSGGGATQLYFGSNTNGLTSQQLALIKFNLSGGAVSPAQILATGEVVPQMPTGGTTNEWTKATSGYWEENFWSLGHLPTFNDDRVAFRNPGFKALGIGTNTTANYSNSLSVNYLTVDGPSNSANQLLLNYAGLNVPLSVSNDFVLGTNGSVVSYSSALRGGNFYMSGPATFSDSTVTFSKIVAGTNVNVTLNTTNSSLSASLMQLGQGAAGVWNQSGGSSQIGVLQVYSNNVYNLNNGTLNADAVYLQSQVFTPGLALLNVSGGSVQANYVRLGLQQSGFVYGRGELRLDGGSFSASQMDFINGSFTHTAGTNRTETIDLSWVEAALGEYFLSNGLLISSNLSAGRTLGPGGQPGYGNFVQSGGIHTNSSMTLWGDTRHQDVRVYGSYSLSTGLLACGTATMQGGNFSQSGGTNYIREIRLDGAGSFGLSGGELVSSNTTLDTYSCVESVFVQNNGNHRVQNQLRLAGFVRYELQDGTLTATNIEIGPGAQFRLLGGSISNAGIFIIRSGAFRVGGVTQQLGQLQVLGVPAILCAFSQPTVPTLDVRYGGATTSTVLHFRDSRDVPWSGTNLSIVHWSASANGAGPHHIFVGTNSQGLTAAQVSQITFVNPDGLPAGNYPARILSTGEIVPAVPPSVAFTRSPGGLVLSWTGDYQLLSATNVAGPYDPIPGATNPFTNPFVGPQRFFQLAP